jgi:hypothetical protein
VAKKVRPSRDSLNSWHRWFGFGGLLFLALGVIGREWPLAGIGAGLGAYAFGILAIKSRRRT